MGCGCKSTNSPKTYISVNGETISDIYKEERNKQKNKIEFIPTLFFYTLKFLGFLIALISIPFIMLAVIWFMFELIVLSKELDMKKVTRVLTSKLKPFNEDYYEELDDEEEEEEFDEDELTLINVEDITNNKN